MLEKISIEYGDPNEKASFVCPQKRFELVIYSAAGCGFVAAIGYAILISVI